MTLFWAVLLRTGQIAIEASTTLLCGLLVAGVLRKMLGSDGTRRLFGGKGWGGLMRAWAVGTLLPVCSLGVIPIARELRRAGVSSGTVLAFVLAAPHINPLSLLYGLTLSEPRVIVCFAVASLAIALLAGWAWDRWLAKPEDDLPPDPEPTPAPGLKRLAAVLVAAMREAVGPSVGFVLIGLVGTGLLAGLLPFGCLSTTMKHADPLAPLLMTGIAVPLYTGPLQGMMRLGLMFEHGNSVGAAFALFELGIGVNAGLFVWLSCVFGWRRVALWLGLIVALTLALAYAAEKPLYFAKEEVEHTHAFDEWASPFPPDSRPTLHDVKQNLGRKLEILEPVALAGLALLALGGLLLTRFDPSGRLDRWLATAPAERARSGLNWYVPGPVLGVVALLGLFAVSVAALYVYYPAPADTLAIIVRTRADALIAVRTRHREEAIRQIQLWDDLTRKLQVGAFIRSGKFDAAAGQHAEDVRERLEEVRDALLAGDTEGAIALVPAVEAAHRRCRDAYEPAEARRPEGP